MTSLNCLVLGQAPTNIFSIFFGENFPVRDFQVKFDVAGFKEAPSEKSGITAMDIWKVELDFHEINNISTEDDIKNHDKERVDDNPMLKFNKYYNEDNKKPKERYLHIFVVPTSAESLKTVGEIIKEISKNLIGLKPKSPDQLGNIVTFS